MNPKSMLLDTNQKLNNMILLAISITVFTTLIWIVVKNFGIQESISASYYRLESKGKGWLFTVGLLGFSWPIIIIAQTPLMFVSGALITFVAIAANYNQSETALKSHVYSAMGSVISGLLSLVVDYHQYYLVGGAVLIALILLFLDKKRIISKLTWWVEIEAYVIIVGYLIFM